VSGQRLKQSAEFVGCETSLLRDISHRVSIDRIVSRDRESAHTVRHNDMLALTDDLEAGLLQRGDRRALLADPMP
jgi:hypothetical protein